MTHFRVSLLIAVLLGLNKCDSLSVIPQRQTQWDHFVLAQQWPMSACIEANNITYAHDCHIPSNVSTWTVHGLWPSFRTSQGPEFCNISNPGVDFDPASLDPILPQLAKFWPNLYRESQFYGFWKHEWCKHGTCALSLTDLNSEVKYFGKGIDLRQAFDIKSILNDAGIQPTDDKTYEFVEFMNALTTGLHAQPRLSCVYDKETKTQYVAEIQFCLSKSFKIMRCPTRYSEAEEFLEADFVEQKNRPRPRNTYVKMMQKRKSLAPESCEQQQQQLASAKPRGSMSPCRDDEPVAYPVIKHI